MPHSLQQQLDDFLAFATGDVLVWHDLTGAAYELGRRLNLPDDVKLYVETDTPRFELICALNNIAPDERAFVIRARRHRVEEDDWLADIEARAENFEPDLAGLSLVDIEPSATPSDPTAPEECAHDIELSAEAEQTEQDLQTSQIEPAGVWYTREAFREALKRAGIAASSDGEIAAATAAGYTLFADCVIRGDHDSPAEYYRMLFAAPLVTHDSLPTDMLSASSFKSYLSSAQAAGTVFGYDKDTWITTAGLQELEISRADLDAFAKESVAASVAAGIPQFTVPWLRANAPGIALLAYGLSDIFYESVLLSRKRFCTRGHLGGRRIFAEPHTQARGRDLVTSLLERESSLDIDELCEILTEEYDIDITIPQLVSLIRATNLFYSPELDRVYVSHDQFIREVE
ncbi:hypothetical protein [Collinsella sp. An307]|uniref:hypothetical protein n=1 Tax=Collinsella sp. An307 TaxID=1965630 RepID=UPI000B36E5EE|nr:hypothetical protein [Collinsella sp. An307]OUO19299.1 hypothetical protein B5F89_08615 [Collinsella sp. An307]